MDLKREKLSAGGVGGGGELETNVLAVGCLEQGVDGWG